MKLAQLFALITVALALTACDNLVVAQRPVLTAEDSAAAPKLKPGLWAQCKGAEDCHDSPMLISATTIELHKPGEPVRTAEISVLPYRLGGSDPLVMQLKYSGQNDVDGIPEAQRDPEMGLYFFAVVEPLSHDGQGRIDVMRASQIVCGPPRKTKDGYERTDRPFAGVTLNDDKTTCSPSDKAGLFSAAHASRIENATAFLLYRWIGDRWPG